MRLRVYHVKVLREFHSRPEDIDPTKFAVKDYNFLMVRSVKGFRPKTFNTEDSRKNRQFLIEWDNDSADTWEPWSNVRNLIEVRKWVLSAACKNKILKNLFPVNNLQEMEESDDEFDEDQAEEAAPSWL
jgi:hypothetical protein